MYRVVLVAFVHKSFFVLIFTMNIKINNQRIHINVSIFKLILKINSMTETEEFFV